MDKLMSESILDQSKHDARYYKAVKAGVSHSQAWFQEKKRRRARAKRFENKTRGERARHRIELELEWHRRFDAGQVADSEHKDMEQLDYHIETEVANYVKNNDLRILIGNKKLEAVKDVPEELRDKMVMEDARGYRPLNRSELEQCKVDSGKTHKWTTAEAKLYNKALDPKYIGLTRRTQKGSGNPQAVARRTRKNEERSGKYVIPADQDHDQDDQEENIENNEIDDHQHEVDSVEKEDKEKEEDSD